LRIKVSGKKIVNGEIYILESNFDYLFSILNGKIDEGIIKNLFTTIRNDNKKIDISFKIPDRVLTGSKYDIDIILNKPLEEVIIAGAVKPYQVNKKLMSKANSDAIFMHCLPVGRGEEVTNEVIDGKQSVVWRQALNRVHAQKSIIKWCLD